MNNISGGQTTKKSWIAEHKLMTGILGGLILIVFLVIFGSGGHDSQPISNTTAPTPTISKEQAQKELDDVMALAKKSTLVKSYEFSDKGSTVYVTAMWYTQDVQFKKDFLAKVAMLKKAVTGYGFFEVHDAISNEKVGEVTAFGGELKVYK